MGKGSRRGARAAEALKALRTSEDVLQTPTGERTEGGFTLRSVGVSDRVFRCPGCNQDVLAVPHVVAWPAGDPEQRRHWHTPCWTARDRRGPTVERAHPPRR